jgi:heme/copper-type cytochrome/quinol oxidase subunit 2
MKMLFTLYSMLLVTTLTSTSILFTLGNWVISRRDREDERLIDVVRVTRRALLSIFVTVFPILLITADLLAMQRILVAAGSLAASLVLTITMAQTLVIMHALMDALSRSANSEGEARSQGAREGTKGVSKP